MPLAQPHLGEVRHIEGILGLAIPLGLIAIAVGIRLFNILALDPFGDEVTWLRWAIDFFNPTRPLTLWTPVTEEGRPPLFFWLLLLTLPIDSNAFVGGRVAAALASGATAGLLYLIGAQLWSRSVGVVAGLLWAVLPFGVIFGRFASSDDSLLALCLALVTLASINAARHPSFKSGVLCGAAIALAILAKTLGVLSVAIPVCAAITLLPRSAYRAIPAIAAGAMIGLVIGLIPLLPWAPQMLKTASFYADLDVEQRPGAGPKHDTAYRVTQNVTDTSEYFLTYVGAPTLVLAAGGTLVGLARRKRSALFLGLVLLAGVVPVLVFTSILYSRYLLGFTLPFYLLAAAALCALWRIFQSRTVGIRRNPSLRIAIVGAAGGALLAAFWPQLALTQAMLTDPSASELPSKDQWRYFEHRWSLFGLSKHATYLKEAAQLGPITVAKPRGSDEWRYALPYNALRFELRGSPTIRFDDIPPVRDQGSSRTRRSIAEASRPTYVITNELGSGIATPGESQAGVAEKGRRFPTATVAQRTVRPDGRYVLTLYREDPHAQIDTAFPETVGPSRASTPSKKI